MNTLHLFLFIQKNQTTNSYLSDVIGHVRANKIENSK